MPFSFYESSTGLHLRGLQVVSDILNKAKDYAAAHDISVDELVEWRLVDDMRPLSFQVQYMCITAVNFLQYAAHMEIPAVEENEKTFADLEARIASTVEILKGVDRASVDGKEDTLVTLPVTKYGEFTGIEYLFGNNIPNFYFHLVTAYDILRAKGIDLAKRDYLRPHIPRQ